MLKNPAVHFHMDYTLNCIFRWAPVLSERFPVRSYIFNVNGEVHILMHTDFIKVRLLTIHLHTGN